MPQTEIKWVFIPSGHIKGSDDLEGIIFWAHDAGDFVPEESDPRQMTSGFLKPADPEVPEKAPKTDPS